MKRTEKHTLYGELRDDEDGSSLPFRVEHTSEGIAIHVDGYEDFEGRGSPIFIERTGGCLRVNIWGDINEELPTHQISLEGARTSLREDDQPEEQN